jgi:hypothetical protein
VQHAESAESHRLSIFVCFLRLQLPEISSSIRRRTQVIDNACQQVKGCERLAAVLQKLLAVGNVMNEGTFQGSAAGFTLDSLLKLTTTKGVDKKTSVLDIVTRMLGEQVRAVATVVVDDECGHEW